VSEIRVRRSHHFTHAEARKGAERVAENLKERFNLSGRWKGDELHFSGSGIEGVLRIEPKAVEIDAKLGFMLALMKPVIEASIHENLDKLFAQPSKGAKKPAPKKK
jgi:putative polyhydroxyalkanoate system protein